MCVCRAFFAESYQFAVPESLPVASVVAKIKALDSDIGPNAEMDYRIIEGDGLGVFRVVPDKDTQEGVIILQRVGHKLPKPYMYFRPHYYDSDAMM